MKRNGTMHSPDDDEAAPAGDDAGRNEHSTASNWSPSLARIDAIAAAALSDKSLVRYHAYKTVLLAREQDDAAVVSTLTLFVSDLTETR